jgi:hypothetical protein
MLIQFVFAIGVISLFGAFVRRLD